MRLPSYNAIRLPFGATYDGYSVASPHKGVDFLPTPTDAIYAPESGRVSLEADTGTNPDGNAVHLWTGNRHHAFCHMRGFNVSQNQQVNEGDLLGYMGTTGDAYGANNIRNEPSSKHLHWALAIDDKLVNGLQYVTPGKGGEDLMTDENYIRAFFIDLFDVQPTQEQINQYVNRPWKDVYNELRSALPHQQLVTYYKQLKIDDDARVKLIGQLQQQLKEAQGSTSGEPITNLTDGLYRVKRDTKG